MHKVKYCLRMLFLPIAAVYFFITSMYEEISKVILWHLWIRKMRKICDEMREDYKERYPNDKI